MTRLEDYLRSEFDPTLPPNLLKRREEFIQEIDSLAEKNLIDAIIDDGGITGIPLTLEHLQELESRSYPNVGYAGWDFSEPLIVDEIEPETYLQRLEEIDHQKTIDYLMNETDISKDELEEERRMSELGYKDWIGDEEHYVDHENYADQLFNDESFQGSELQKSLIEMDREITFQVGRRLSEEIDKMIMDPVINTEVGDEEYHYKSESDELPDYLLNDPEIVGYPDRVIQAQIYDWILSKIEDHSTIKDLGCGRGDFYKTIQDSELDLEYFGIDSNPNLIQVGHKKYPEIKLIDADFNDVSIQTDYTICIGTLNDDHRLDKWEFFNKTLNHALNNTKTAVLLVLQADCYGEQGHLDYPIAETITKLPAGTRFEIDNSKFEDIYSLIVHIGDYN